MGLLFHSIVLQSVHLELTTDSYRNIQMMISYIQKTHSEGHGSFTGRIPSIIHLQERIEHAWDMGINEMARVETGGIRGTRKYIGTPEVSYEILRRCSIVTNLQGSSIID